MKTVNIILQKTMLNSMSGPFCESISPRKQRVFDPANCIEVFDVDWEYDTRCQKGKEISSIWECRCILSLHNRE